MSTNIAQITSRNGRLIEGMTRENIQQRIAEQGLSESDRAAKKLSKAFEIADGSVDGIKDGIISTEEIKAYDRKQTWKTIGIIAAGVAATALTVFAAYKGVKALQARKLNNMNLEGIDPSVERSVQVCSVETSSKRNPTNMKTRQYLHVETAGDVTTANGAKNLNVTARRMDGSIPEFGTEGPVDALSYTFDGEIIYNDPKGTLMKCAKQAAQEAKIAAQEVSANLDSQLASYGVKFLGRTSSAKSPLLDNIIVEINGNRQVLTSNWYSSKDDYYKNMLLEALAAGCKDLSEIFL